MTTTTMQSGDVVPIDVPFVAILRNWVARRALHSSCRTILLIPSPKDRTRRDHVDLNNALQPHQVLIDLTMAEGAATGLLAASSDDRERLHKIPHTDAKRVVGCVSFQPLYESETVFKSPSNRSQCRGARQYAFCNSSKVTYLPC